MSELKTTSLSHKDNATGTPNITMYPDGTTSIGLTQTGGFKNALINGDFNIMQRSDGFGNVVLAAADNGYAMDRWRGAPDSTNSKRVSSNGYVIYQQLMGNAGDNSYAFQPVELMQGGQRDSAGTLKASNAPFNIGTTWTLSFYCDNLPTAVSEIIAWRKISRSGSDDVAVSNNVPTLQATGKTIDSGNYGILTQYSTTFTVDTEAPADSTCLVVHISGEKSDQGGGAMGNVWANAQLEPGPTVSDFEFRFIGTETSLCQRYYYRTASDASTTNIMTMCNENAVNASGSVPHPVLMRIPPEVTYGGGIRYYTSAVGVGKLFTSAGDRSSTSQLVSYIDVEGGIPGGDSGSLYKASETDGFIEVDAEL